MAVKLDEFGMQEIESNSCCMLGEASECGGSDLALAGKSGVEMDTEYLGVQVFMK
jgi:hypothetical protein